MLSTARPILSKAAVIMPNTRSMLTRLMFSIYRISSCIAMLRDGESLTESPVNATQNGLHVGGHRQKLISTFILRENYLVLSHSECCMDDSVKHKAQPRPRNPLLYSKIPSPTYVGDQISISQVAFHFRMSCPLSQQIH